jgi:hypothetical protein
MAHPTLEDARRLVEWTPPLGVLSVYLRYDPPDRGGAWRTGLRNGLAEVLKLADGLEHEARTAIRATADHVSERLDGEDGSPSRGEVGFIAVSRAPAEQRWWETQVPPNVAAGVRLDARPVVAPLLRLIQRSRPRGVALISAERVRLLEWQPRKLTELHTWELSVFSRDWRERKAQRVADPARGQSVSSSGRDQFRERLAENRERFLGECGRLALERAAERDWPEVLAFGQPQQIEGFRQGPESAGAPIEIGKEIDLIGMPLGEAEAAVEEAVDRLSAKRETLLVERALERARSSTGGCAGPKETLAALGSGRVKHLLLDAALATRAVASPNGEPGGSQGGAPVDPEALVRQGLATGAEIGTVAGEAADQLAQCQGVAALLRY